MKQDFGAIRQFNLTLEREWHGLGLRASYIGTRGSGLNYSLNVDKPQASTTPFTSAAYPYLPVYWRYEYRQDGQLRYNSAQFEVSRRMGQFTFDASWTWSNTMFNYGILENPYALGRWERDQYARRQYIPMSATWMVPFGKGRHFLAGAPSAVDAVRGRLDLQTIGTLLRAPTSRRRSRAPIRRTPTLPADCRIASPMATCRTAPARGTSGSIRRPSRSRSRAISATAAAIPWWGRESTWCTRVSPRISALRSGSRRL